MNNKILHNISYGVYVISTLNQSDNDNNSSTCTGCIANSIMQVTSSPATIAVSINHDNYTNSCIKACKQFAISILTEKSDPSIIGTFGFQTGKETDKFSQVDHKTAGDLAIVTDSSGYILCEVIDTLETSTHTVFLGKVTDGEILDSSTPMTYSYYHQVIKGRSPKNAPTYQAPEEETRKTETTVSTSDPSSDAEEDFTWTCSVCGYEYDGDIPFEELGDDFVCPICKMPKSKFKKIPNDSK